MFLIIVSFLSKKELAQLVSESCNESMTSSDLCDLLTPMLMELEVTELISFLASDEHFVSMVSQANTSCIW